MATRYIGDAVIRITYRGGDTYIGSVCVGKKCWRFDDLNAARVGFGDHAYDSPEAYDKMAASAVSFGSYYTSTNRGDEVPDWAPSPEVADAIDEAISWTQDAYTSEYEVRRSKARAENPKKVTKTSTTSVTTTRNMNPGFFSNPFGVR